MEAGAHRLGHASNLTRQAPQVLDVLKHLIRDHDVEVLVRVRIHVPIHHSKTVGLPDTLEVNLPVLDISLIDVNAVAIPALVHNPRNGAAATTPEIKNPHLVTGTVARHADQPVAQELSGLPWAKER